MAYLFYVAIKLICYAAWCWVGLRLWRASANLKKAAGFGVLRLAIGVAFGTVVFFAAGSIQAENMLWKYLAIYTPIRVVEWLILALIIGRSSEKQTTLNSTLWCVGGIVVSFVADLASPEGVAGHFCVGRCLC